MARLKALKPRLTAIRPALTTMQPGSWRTSAMTSGDRGYTDAWRKARSAWLQEHPLCVYCAEAGKVTGATLVDHIEPHRGNMALFWKRSNWQSLCTGCHSGRKQREEREAERATWD
jgi:5-methylcytosine-specific restriction protein A